MQCCLSSVLNKFECIIIIILIIRIFLGYGPGASLQYGQVPQGSVPYPGAGTSSGSGSNQLGYSGYGQQAPLGPRMNSQGSAYSMYSAPPMGDSRMYPIQHATEQYPSGMHQNATPAMTGWPGQIPPQGKTYCHSCQ